MRNILIDFTYYQGGMTFHGGGEYGNVILEELLKRSEQRNCGIFFLKGKRINRILFDKCIERGWNIHAGCDVRNIPSIIEQYHYTTIYSALPYINRWDKVKFSNKNIRLIGTFHGLRNLELADCAKDETEFLHNGTDIVQSGYIYGAKDIGQRNNSAQIYYDALKAFINGKIIAVSEHTKNSIYYYFPDLQNADIEVLYSPAKLISAASCFEDDAILNSFGVISGNYGLIVSAGIWYKNGLRAALAYDSIFERNLKFIPKNYRVVIVGVKDKTLFMKRIIHKERFVLLDYVSSETLEIFYRNTQLFIYPSLNEGFGYPPLEAMKYGTLCACSVNTSIAEVCKDMVLYFNPLLVDEIAIRILESFSDKIRKEKEELIKQQLPFVQQRQKRDD